MSDSINEEDIARRLGVAEAEIVRARSHPRGIASGLFEQGAIDRESYEDLVTAIRQTVALTIAQRQALPMVCSGCGARWKVRNAHPSKRYSCRKCKKPLVVELSVKNLKAGEEAEQTGETRDLPPEVLAAMEQPANLFGKYVMLGEVGRGGMGRVYRGYDTELGRVVALKVMLFQSEEEIARFRQEALLAAKLDHPGIVHIYELGEVEGRPYISMQFVEGGNLDGGRKGVRRAVEAARDAARAIAHAHRHGVIHRDVKPSNLLESKDGRIRVTDFGLAKESGTRSVSGTVVGTPSYMSPEQARGDTSLVGTLSDVYSLGATLYGLLAGASPFPGKQVAQILHAVSSRDPVPLRDLIRVPGDVETVIGKAMEKDPDRRYATAEAFADDLDRFLQGEPIHARRASVAYRLRKGIAKRKAVVAIALLGLAGVAAVAATLVPRLVAEREAKERAETEVRSLRNLAGLWTQVVLAKQGFHNRTNDPLKVRTKIRDLITPVNDFIRANPRLPQGYYIRARARLYLDELDEAEADLRTAVGLEPAFAPGHALLSRVKFEQYQWKLYSNSGNRRNTFQEAAPLLDEARQELSLSAEAGSERASVDKWGLVKTQEDEVVRVMSEAFRARLVDRDLARADRILKEADAREGSAEICNWLGLFQTDLAEMIRWQTRAIDLMPLWGKPYLDRAGAREDKREIDLALEDYDQAIRLDPRRLIAWVNRGAILFRKGDLERASQDFEQALRLDPSNGLALWNRAVLRLRKGELDGALADVNRALELDPRHAGAYRTRSQIRMERKDMKGALADAELCIELQPKVGSSFFARAAVRSFTGDYEGAIADYTHSLELRPDNPEAYNNLAALRLARGDMAGALREADRAVQLAPRMAEAAAMRGMIRHRSGDLKGAAADFDRAIELHPKLEGAHFYRSLIAASQEDWAAARSFLEKAEQLGFARAELFLAKGRLYETLSRVEPASARPHLQTAAAALEKAVARKAELGDAVQRAEAEAILKSVREALGR